MAKRQPSLFEDNDKQNIDQSGIIKLSNNLIRGKGRIKKIAVKRGDKMVNLSTTTSNDKKIEDTCLEIFQSEFFVNKVKDSYLAYHKEALWELEPLFKEHGLVYKEDYSNKKKEEIEQDKQIAIDSWIKDKIAEDIPSTLRFPIKDFIERTAISRIQSRFNEALETINNSSKKTAYSWMEQSVEFITDPKTGKKTYVQKNDLKAGSIIPVFGLGFNEKLKDVLTPEQIKNLTMEEFIEMPLNSKYQYVDDFIMEVNPRNLLEIMGVGLFTSAYGKGYAKSLRKNRNQFKRSITFQFDFLVRSIMDTRYENLKKFTFDELKNHLHATGYNGWESFKKSVLLPVMEDFENNTEMTCDYKLYPNQKEWTHIMLLPKWKTNSMGFEAEKEGFDYLAYFIAVQHKYFQPNKLSENLEAFVAYMQSRIYNSVNGEDIYGRTLDEWKEYGKKTYEAEKELLQMIEDNEDILKTNNLIYDKRRMCLVKSNVSGNNGNDEVIEVIDNSVVVKTLKMSKTSYIKTDEYDVKDPISSLRYLCDIGTEEKVAINIFDFIPFDFATLDSNWIKIDSLEVYAQYVDPIRTAAYKKKSSFFRFENKDIRETFLYYLNKRRFKEFNDRFIELMEQIS
ncbi:MAG TPA: hypothetical protein K8U92_02170 [Aliarcobacter thereius]|nr:hypothetical protein [Aliarcobacter thereius]HJE02658.1 hypothetical protein [Aliarcobacter thereius]